MTTTDQVRTITGLSELEVTNDNIATHLELNDNSVKLAAADALEVYASTLTSVQSDDISIDGSKRATVLLKRAASLREQAAAAIADSDDGFSFDVVNSGTCRPELTERRPCW